MWEAFCVINLVRGRHFILLNAKCSNQCDWISEQADIVDLRRKAVCSPVGPPCFSHFPWLVVLPLFSKYNEHPHFPLLSLCPLAFASYVPLLGDPWDYSGLCQMTEIASSQNPHLITSAMPPTPTASGEEKLNIHSCVKYVTLCTLNIWPSSL